MSPPANHPTNPLTTPWPLYLAGVSLQRFKDPAFEYPADLPGLALDLGFQGIALSDRDLARWSPAAISALARGAARRGCGLILDLNADLTLSRPESLARELQHLRRWLKLAAGNGLTRVRLALGGQAVSYQRLVYSRRPPAASGTAERSGAGVIALPLRRRIRNELLLPASRWLQRLLPVAPPRPDRAVEKSRLALSLVLQWAAQHAIRIGIENHWGVTTHPEELEAILNYFNSPFLGSCPDFGNFPSPRNPYMGLALLARRAVLVHAKSRAFDPSGEETRLDYRRCLGILRIAKFKGPICVEYEGRRDPIEAILNTRDLIRRHQFGG